MRGECFVSPGNVEERLTLRDWALLLFSRREKADWKFLYAISLIVRTADGKRHETTKFFRIPNDRAAPFNCVHSYIIIYNENYV